MDQNHSELYKVKGIDAQEKRRQELLSNQKNKREALLDEFRNIVVTKFHRKHWKKKQRHYEIVDMLMLSEWFIQVPEDFSTCWKFIVCPVGRRCLIVAKNGTTIAVSKKGKEFAKWETPLPGGNCSQPGVTTILDCVYSNANETFYVLDVLHWGDLPCVGTEMNFRQFWIQSRIKDELPELSQLRRPIVPLEAYSCCEETIQEILGRYPYWHQNTPNVDGILFYHQDAFYTQGQTPLVGWLKVFMIPEVLGVDIDANYFSDRSDDYVNYLSFIENFEKNRKVKKIVDVDMDDLINVELDES